MKLLNPAEIGSFDIQCSSATNLRPQVTGEVQINRANNLFWSNTNVKRIRAAMTAIQIMQQRDAFDSALRREMLTSLMVEQALGKHVDRISGNVGGDIKKMR